MTKVDWKAGIIEHGAFGRNGTMKTRGVIVDHFDHVELTHLRPITSKGAPGQCAIYIPYNDRADVARAIYPEIANAIPDKLYIVHAEHFSIPLVHIEPYSTKRRATARAVELVNILLDDSDREANATADDWEHHLAWLQDCHGAAHCFVEILEKEIDKK